MEFNKVWPVPHSARLDRPMESGQMVTVKGQVLELNLKELPDDQEPAIVINLAGDAQNKNIALHVSIRYRQNTVVLNNCVNGEWGKEERHKNIFALGKPIHLRIRAHNDHFEITSEGKDYCKFEYRVPLSSVNHVYVDGPLALYGVQWGGRYYSVPYEAGIGAFGVGKRLFLSAEPEKKCKSFALNLNCENGDTAFHFNPRVNDKVVVRNSKKGGAWENEEREIQGEFPFKPELGFDLVIVNESYSFQVFLNDKKFCTFAHRMDPNTIRSVKVEGDLELQSLIVL